MFKLYSFSRRAYSFALLLLFFAQPSQAQENEPDPFSPVYPESVRKGRLRTVIITESAAYAGAMFGLYQIWYKDNKFSGFHFYNDNDHWLQIDKFGHAYSAYAQGVAGYHALRWAGVDDKKSAIFGGGLGIIMQTPIEILDGFSTGWGASGGDLIANTSGSLLFVGQQLAWQEQRVRMKFSYFPSKYPDYRPGKFGETFATQLVQDYNAQTFWLSANISKFVGKETKGPFSWLALAVGYGADGMLSNTENPETNRAGEALPSFDRRRQFYLALDVDLTSVKTRSRVLRTLFTAASLLKFPAPALELTQRSGLRFHPVFF